jgi:hypothetical protein
MSGAKDGTCILWRNLTVAHAYQLQTERQGILSVAVDADHHAYVYQVCLAHIAIQCIEAS